MGMCKDSVRWVYKLEQNFAWESQHRVSEDLIFRDKEGVVRLVIEAGGRITVMSGYAWNGCSPKICVWDLLMGTPDGVVYAKTGRPKTYYASLVHDALYQFLAEGSPLGRQDADGCFLRLCAESEFSPRYVYWLVLRAIGGIVWRATRKTRDNHGTRQPVSEISPAG